MALGVIGILYGAAMAFAQTDMKRLVAYSSIAHMGFVLIGAFTASQAALEGAVMQMLAHGLATGALFILVGALQARLHTREMAQLGGLWDRLPRLSALLLFFAIAALGLPGTGNFIGELLVLIGVFSTDRVIAVLAALGLVAAAVYALALVQRTVHGPPQATQTTGPADLALHEGLVLAVLAVGVLALGLHPQPLLDLAVPSMEIAP
jgi:NADH-quinone oxidoreductase subunit M